MPQALTTMRTNRPSIRDAIHKRRTPDEVEAAVEGTPPAAPVVAIPVAPSSVLEQEILAILARPAPVGETLRSAYQQLEHDLGSVLARLSLVEARQLHQRFVNPRDTDELTAKFFRLIPERRDRLITFLADAPRRAALASRSRR
jgi:hypothetical protein